MSSRQALRNELIVVPVIWAGLIGYWAWRLVTLILSQFI